LSNEEVDGADEALARREVEALRDEEVAWREPLGFLGCSCSSKVKLAPLAPVRITSQERKVRAMR
jgi:hypothetical protein